MKYTSPVKFNNSVLSNPKTKRFGTKLFWSLFCPVLMIVIACIISKANGVGLFVIGSSFDNLSNVMIMGRTAVMTLIAALALNTNLNSGRMDFSLGATGILACLFASSMSGSMYGASTVLGQVGLNVVIAIVFGGMTTSGGPKSKVSCAVIGAFFSVFLDEFFAAISTPTFQVGDYSFMVKGAIFILISLANMWDTRTKMLASGGSIQ